MWTIPFEVFLGLLFVSAALLKVGAWSAFRDAVARFDLVPSAAASALAAVVFILEVIVGTMLIVGLYPLVAASLAAMLLSAFILAIAVNLWRGHGQISCGCWGDDGEELSWMHVGVNGLLLLAAAVITARATMHAPGSSASAFMLERWTSAPALVLAVVGIHLAVAFHVARQWRRLGRLVADRLPAGVQ